MKGLNQQLLSINTSSEAAPKKGVSHTPLSTPTHGGEESSLHLTDEEIKSQGVENIGQGHKVGQNLSPLPQPHSIPDTKWWKP
jgi:hypothetical protein